MKNNTAREKSKLNACKISFLVCNLIYQIERQQNMVLIACDKTALF